MASSLQPGTTQADIDAVDLDSPCEHCGACGTGHERWCPNAESGDGMDEPRDFDPEVDA